MASKADKHAARSLANATPQQADAGSSSLPSQVSVLLVQVEALHEDDAIRFELKKAGFHLKHQALVHFSKEEAHAFIYQVCDPASTLHHSPHHPHLSSEDASEVSVNATSTSESEEEIRGEKSSSSSGGGGPPHERPLTAASPRDKLATTPRVQDDRENLEAAVLALVSGPALMLAVEKPNAVLELLELVGSCNPDLWATAPNTFRARFGKTQEELGVRCSLQEATVAKEIEFLLAHSGTKREKSHGSNPHAKRTASVASTKSADVDLEQLLDFLFPPHLQHPNSAGRLFVFGLYGPLDGKARLRSGEKGLHIVTDLELTTMSKRMEREDILNVYKMCSLSQDDEEQVLRQVDQLMKSFPQYTPRDITALFRHAERSDVSGRLSFHRMQATIMKERCRRVLCMKEQLHPALAPPIQNLYRHTLKRIMKTKDEVAPVSLFLKDIGFTGAENATLVSRLLSNHSFEICHLDDGNSPSLTQNVRLLRDQIRPEGETRDPWNPSCQHRK